MAPSITRWLARIALQPHPDPLPGRLQTRQLVLRLVERIGAHCLVVATEEEVLDPAGVARRLHLSRREGEVLYWLAAGKDRTQVGQLLSISKRTVGKHCENLFPKLGVTNRAAAVRLVLARGALR